MRIAINGFGRIRRIAYRSMMRGGRDLELVADERELSEISEALDRLAQSDPLLAELVDLKFFCGFSFAEIAAMRRTSERTVQRHWQKARLYLHRKLRPGYSI